MTDREKVVDAKPQLFETNEEGGAQTSPPSGDLTRQQRTGGARNKAELPKPRSLDDPSQDAPEKGDIWPSEVVADPDKVANILERGYRFGKSPLFVLGAGMSYGQVPLLHDIAKWFKSKIEDSQGSNPENTLVKSLERLIEGKAEREEAAVLFESLQSQKHHDLWQKFSHAFLFGESSSEPIGESSSEPTTLSARDFRFKGLIKAVPTDAHKSLAHFLMRDKAYAVSLNFDGLTVRALWDGEGKRGVALHTEDEIRRYFCLAGEEFLPAVIKIRGDVFYAQCTTPACPQHADPYPLDKHSLLYHSLEGQANILKCPTCGAGDLVLQFSFPGFRAKEEKAYPLLREAMRFLAQRLSAIVFIGFSGRWDAYLLDFLFYQALQRRIPVIDVKPKLSDDMVIYSFAKGYYPSYTIPDNALFHRVHCTADDFMNLLSEKCNGDL